jgi:uncharacterized membrane protein YfcA
MLPSLMLMDVVSLEPYWGKWLKKEALYLALGGVAIGAIILLFVFWQFVQSRQWVRPAAKTLPEWVGLLSGGAGFTSFVSHAGGPPAAIYLLSSRPSKTQYQATTVTVFWIINVAKAIPYVSHPG